MSLVKIYTLIDPRDGCVFYVGATSKELSQRLSGHMYRERIKAIKSVGLRPNILIVDEVKPSLSGQREWEWIERYRSWGYSLENSVYRTSFTHRCKMKDPVDPVDVVIQDDTNPIYRAHSPGYFKQLTFTADLINSDRWEDFKLFCKLKLGKKWQYEKVRFLDETDSLGHYTLADYSLDIFSKAA